MINIAQTDFLGIMECIQDIVDIDYPDLNMSEKDELVNETFHKIVNKLTQQDSMRD